MSRVTNVILLTSIVDVLIHTIDTVNTNLVNHLPFKHITTVNSEKNLEVGIYIAAFNHLHVPDLIQAIESVKWHRPNQLQLLIKPDRAQGGKFEEIRLDLEQAPPPRAPCTLATPQTPFGPSRNRPPQP